MTTIKFQDTNIQLLGSGEEILYKANDIGKILDITNIRGSVWNFKEDEKKSCVYKTNGGNQTLLFLTTKGLKRLICNTRKPNAIKLAEFFNINTSDTYYIPFETSIVNFLKLIYKDYELIHQYNVEPYKIDLYLPYAKIAIECDEKYHEYQEEDDIDRENYIKEKLNCVFIRIKQKGNSVDTLTELVHKINERLDDIRIDNAMVTVGELVNERKELHTKCNKHINKIKNLIMEKYLKDQTCVYPHKQAIREIEEYFKEN